MATRLQSSLLIITTTLGNQPTYVTPKDGAMERILVYEPIGSGHYDAALPYCDTLSQVSMLSSVKVCELQMWSQKKRLEKFAHTVVLYASRCKYYLMDRPCTSICLCKGCNGVHMPQLRVGKRISCLNWTYQQAKSLLSGERGEIL